MPVIALNMYIIIPIYLPINRQHGLYLHIYLPKNVGRNCSKPQFFKNLPFQQNISHKSINITRGHRSDPCTMPVD